MAGWLGRTGELKLGIRWEETRKKAGVKWDLPKMVYPRSLLGSVMMGREGREIILCINAVTFFTDILKVFPLPVANSPNKIPKSWGFVVLLFCYGLYLFKQMES